MLRAAGELADDGGLEACSHAAGVSLLEGARLAVSAGAAGLLVRLPVEERIAVGDWSAGGRQPTTTRVTAPAGLTLARAAVPPIIHTSYALARLLELNGPVRLTMPAADPSSPSSSPSEEATPEEFAADLAPEPVADSGHEATVLDLDAARAARGAELTAVEEAATAAALVEQLAREQAGREAEERAVADALRRAALNRARIAQALELADAVTADVDPVAEPGRSFTIEVPVTPLTASERLGMFSATRDPMADTASLMRELTSLGDVDDGPAENRTPARPAVAPDLKRANDKERKGFFGR